MIDPDFYLASTEQRVFEAPRRCWRVKRLAVCDRDDVLLIRIDPPLIGQPYGLGGRDIDHVLVATRHAGQSLFPIREWPVYVHVLRALMADVDSRDHLRNGEFQAIAWAELYRTEDDARLKVM